MKLAAFAGGSPFAHLLGRSSAKTKAEEDKKYKDVDDSEKVGKKKADDEGDDTAEDIQDKKKDEAEDDLTDNTEDADESDDDGNIDVDDDRKAKKAKTKSKAKASEEDSDDDDDMKSKAARKRERARCAAIFKSPYAGVNPVAAAHLAFETDMPSGAAIGLMAAMAAGTSADDKQEKRSTRSTLDERMSRSRNPDIGAGADAQKAPDPATALAARIVAADKKRRGETA